MIKVVLMIALFIILTEQSLTTNSSNFVNKHVCDSSVRLDKFQYLIKGRFDEKIYCNLRSIDNCLSNEHNVSIKFLVNNVSYSLGAVDCKKNEYDSRFVQTFCSKRLLLGIEDLNSNNLFGDEYNISCVATMDTNYGEVKGQSENSTLIVFRGELFGNLCSDRKPCISNRNITCNENYCKCKNGFYAYFDNFGINSCAPKAKYNEVCRSYQQCVDYNTICTPTSNGKLCLCNRGYFWDGSQCMNGYINGYPLQQYRSCPSCYCNESTCFNVWAFFINLFAFLSGMLGGVFANKTYINYQTKRNESQTNLLTDQKSYVSSITDKSPY